jgi:uncharacterized protein (UPF0179 family)
VKLTIVGENLAKPGLVFTYAGETDPGCKACKLHNVCHGDLKPNRDYRITAARPVKHKVCHVFEGDVQIVEVEEKPLPLRIAIPANATRGTGVSKRWEECGASCLLKRHCNPSGLAEGQAASITKVEGDVPCLVGRKLKFALVEPQ